MAYFKHSIKAKIHKLQKKKFWHKLSQSCKELYLMKMKGHNKVSKESTTKQEEMTAKRTSLEYSFVES